MKAAILLIVITAASTLAANRTISALEYKWPAMRRAEMQKADDEAQGRKMRLVAARGKKASRAKAALQ